MNNATDIITSRKAVMGMELGSTRIKAVLTAPDGTPLANGGHDWENSLSDGIWTYSLDDAWKGVAACWASLVMDVQKRYEVELTGFACGGFSAMMHGYLAFDESGELLVPFRTWRNNITGEASKELTAVLNYPMPQRWSVVHLHQALLNGEEHIRHVRYITTLAGYVHWKLTGRKVLGIDDASGMFPIDLKTGRFDIARLASYDINAARCNPGWKLKEILPEVLKAGYDAGKLTPEGARLLDPTGHLQAGIPLCPPEGDAGTGMVATNSVRPGTGNVSAGTSVFAMLVMDKEPLRVHDEIDLVATPDGMLAGMAHSNNCTSDYDAWINLFDQAAKALGIDVPKHKLYDTLLEAALNGDPDCGGLLAYGYVSGEHVTGFSEGRPLFVRHPESPLTLENFIRTHLFTALCAMRVGLNVLKDEEGVVADCIQGHGGFFKTAHVGQRIMAAATGTPVRILKSAGEGGAYGMSLLAAYAARSDQSVNLPDYLDGIFADSMGTPVSPVPADVEGFNVFFKRYLQGLEIEEMAVEKLG